MQPPGAFLAKRARGFVINLREDRFAIFPANSVKSAAVRTSQAAFSRLPLRPRK